MKLKLAAPALTATLVAAVALPVLSHAQAPGTAASPTTITFQETAPKVVITDVPPRSKNGDTASQGDKLVTYGALFDTAHHRLGTISGDCTAVGPSKAIFRVALLCTVTYKVAGGQIVAAGNFALSGDATLPIVGGSGAYAGARGTVTSTVKPAKGFDDADVITLLP
jgi:hypothetical protein